VIRSRLVLPRLLLFAALALPVLSLGHASASFSAPLQGVEAPRALPLGYPPILLSLARLPDRVIFARASARSGVPLPLLLAVSYARSLWDAHRGCASIDGGYGLMDLARTPGHDTVDLAARLLRVAPARVMDDDVFNALGGALLLAWSARSIEPRHTPPATLAGWQAAVTWLAGLRTTLATRVLVDGVYDALARGVVARDPAGHAFVLAAVPGVRPRVDIAGTRPRVAPRDGTADYPGAIWAPSPNYAPANRPSSVDVRYAVIHDTEGGCAGALATLQSRQSGDSAHFLVCQDGTVYQLVHVRDIAYHAGNWYINQHSVGIEHEGFRDGSGYTQAQYDASAAILRWLDASAGGIVAPDRNAIFGHENVPGANHTDPGPLWDWGYYLGQVRGGTAYDGGDPGIAMVATGGTTLYSCPDPSCTVMGTADWGEQFALDPTPDTSAPGWAEVYYNGATAWIGADVVMAGAGTRLMTTAATVNVRDAPSTNGTVIGTIPGGQVYVSRSLDPSLDAAGWWLIAYNHRYGFVSSRYLQALSPSGQTVATAAPTLPVGSASPSPFAGTPTIPATVTTTATMTATITVTATPTLTPTVTPTATVSPTATATPSPSPTATLGPRLTELRARRDTRPASRSRAEGQRAWPRQGRSPRASPLDVTLPRTHVLAGSPLRLRAHTAAGRAVLRYTIALPGGATLRGVGRSDARGNATQAFIMPGRAWLQRAVWRSARHNRGRGAHGPLPHSVAASYTVTATWRGRLMSRHGAFRIALWRPA